MMLMPVPGIGNDLFYLAVCRLPARDAADFFGSGDEDGRVAGAARCFFDFEVFARDFLGGFDRGRALQRGESDISVRVG